MRHSFTFPFLHRNFTYLTQIRVSKIFGTSSINRWSRLCRHPTKTPTPFSKFTAARWRVARPFAVMTLVIGFRVLLLVDLTTCQTVHNYNQGKVGASRRFAKDSVSSAWLDNVCLMGLVCLCPSARKPCINPGRLLPTVQWRSVACCLRVSVFYSENTN